ncbi:unnamed protein product, partial [Amoebophrya sp. A25]
SISPARKRKSSPPRGRNKSRSASSRPRGNRPLVVAAKSSRGREPPKRDRSPPKGKNYRKSRESDDKDKKSDAGGRSSDEASTRGRRKTFAPPAGARPTTIIKVGPGEYKRVRGDTSGEDKLDYRGVLKSKSVSRGGLRGGTTYDENAPKYVIPARRRDRRDSSAGRSNVGSGEKKDIKDAKKSTSPARPLKILRPRGRSPSNPRRTSKPRGHASKP